MSGTGILADTQPTTPPQPLVMAVANRVAGPPQHPAYFCQAVVLILSARRVSFLSQRSWVWVLLCISGWQGNFLLVWIQTQVCNAPRPRAPLHTGVDGWTTNALVKGRLQHDSSRELLPRGVEERPEGARKLCVQRLSRGQRSAL